MVSKYQLNPLPSPRECIGYPTPMVRNAPESEIDFLLKATLSPEKRGRRNSFRKIRGERQHTNTLACSLITRESSFDFNEPITSEQLTEQLTSAINTTKPVVVICHGFMSWRNQMLLYNLASELSTALDAHVVRFDFTGNGHSNGEWKYANYEQEHLDLCTIVDFIKSFLGCKVACIIGHSQGMASVLQYAASVANDEKEGGYDDKCKYFVNLAGVYSIPGEIDPTKKLPPQQCTELKESGLCHITSFFGKKTFKITQDRIDFRKHYDSSQHVKHLKGDSSSVHFLTIHGREDTAVSVDNANRFHREISNHSIHIIDGADHNFNGLRFIDRMVSEIKAFMNKRG